MKSTKEEKIVQESLEEELGAADDSEHSYILVFMIPKEVKKPSKEKDIFVTRSKKPYQDAGKG